MEDEKSTSVVLLISVDGIHNKLTCIDLSTDVLLRDRDYIYIYSLKIAS
jgi:hypothetical protein